MADINYIVPGSGIIQDTEEDFESIIPGAGIYNQNGVEGVTQDPSGTLPAMSGAVTRQRSYNREIGGSI